MWFDCTKTALKKLKCAYNNSLRRFMRFTMAQRACEMFVNLNIYSFDEMLRIFTFGFMSRVTVSSNLFNRAFTTHHVVCIQTFGPGEIIYYT